jgi:poly(hydroxyalkanoate) depolymerase family esterase
MKQFFNDMFGEATRLTQSGDLMAATEAIQRALRGDPVAPAAEHRGGADGLVIDAETRVIDEPTTGRAARQDEPAASPTGTKGTTATTATTGTTSTSGTAEQWLAGRFEHQGRELAYKLYVPPRAAGATEPRPLLLMLHGCTQDANDFAAGTRMNALAREAGMLVLYPEQIQHANAQKCWNWFKTQHQARGRGEPALLAALTRKLMAEHQADPARVYVAGLSAGGAMADIMGRAYPELFAAVGVHSGLPGDVAGDLPAALSAMRSGPMPGARIGRGGTRPIIVFHGDADSTVHPSNGEAIAQATRGAGITGDGVPEVSSGRASSGQRYTCTVDRAADGTPLVEHWRLHGAGHAWSGGSSAGSYTAPGVDASAEMLRFFLSHKRPPAG